MAVTVSVLKRYSLGRTGQDVIGTITFDSSYATGGEALGAIPDVEYIHHLTVNNASGYSFEWDGSATAPKVKAFRGDNANAAAAPQVEVSAAVDLSAVTARFRAVCG